MQTKCKYKLFSFLSSLLFLSFLILCLLVFVDTFETWKIENTSQQLAQLRKACSDSSDWSNGMLSINKDYTGWLNVIGTNINGPVVQGQTNDDYLRTDFYGNPSVGGTFFVDESVDLSSDDGNIIIYGHLMNDGTMFADLKKYKDKNFFIKNNTIRWECKSGIYYYQLFGGMIVSGDDTPLRTWINLESSEEIKMLDDIQSSAYFYQEDQFRTGPYLFLVTCDYQQKNGRLVLIASRV